MSEKIKLSKEELEVLRGYQQEQNQITFNLGNVDIQKAILEGQRSQIIRWVSYICKKNLIKRLKNSRISMVREILI